MLELRLLAKPARTESMPQNADAPNRLHQSRGANPSFVQLAQTTNLYLHRCQSRWEETRVIRGMSSFAQESA